MLALNSGADVNPLLITDFFKAICILKDGTEGWRVDDIGISPLSYEYALLVAVYVRLKTMELTEMTRRAILFIEMHPSAVSGSKYIFTSYVDVKAIIAKDDFEFFAKYSWQYCVYLLYAFKDEYSKAELRCWFLHLLCNEEGDDLLLEGILDDVSPFNTAEVFRDIFLQLVISSQLPRLIELYTFG